ncbi:MAG: hypothetical protein J3R72DRAFT_457169 [Linnemannia gamsii]|nr:MAG: hypothetical protein J3R72DRAFT_457169 [Linnemannia gamsii]
MRMLQTKQPKASLRYLVFSLCLSLFIPVSLPLHPPSSSFHFSLSHTLSFRRWNPLGLVRTRCSIKPLHPRLSPIDTAKQCMKVGQ